MSDEARILIVEADVLVRHPLAQYLRECGYSVLEAQNPDEAKLMLEQDDLPVDIVLAEGDSGFDLARWVREHHPQVEMIPVGSVARAAEKAGELCEDGPGQVMPYEHKFVLERIRRMVATRKRAT